MISPRFIRLSVVSLFALGAFGVSRAASAQSVVTCAKDADCGQGFTCQVVGASACPAIACAPGSTCTQPVCDPQVIKQCQPGPCNTNADCATGMICFTDSVQSCPAVSVPACPPNADCAVPTFDAGACTTMSSKSCVPQYDVPCKVDSDCGAGFTCVPETVSECSGSGSAGSASVGSSAGSADAAPPAYTGDASAIPLTTCTTTTLSTSSCQLDTILCTTVADCPSTQWTCAQPTNASNAVCVGPALRAIDGGTQANGCDPAPASPTQCLPPYAYLTGIGSELGSASTPAAGTVTNGSAGSTDNTGNQGTGASTAPSTTHASAGCQLVSTSAGGSGGASLFALLGLVGLVRRRSR